MKGINWQLVKKALKGPVLFLLALATGQVEAWKRTPEPWEKS